MSVWYPEAERFSTPYRYGALSAVAVVLHRTFGFESGDMSVALGKSRPGISFHFYIPKRSPATVRQFLPVNVRAAHAKGANAWSVGIEFESRSNDDPLRDTQIEAAAKLFSWLHRTLGVPLTYDPGPRKLGKRPGFLAHLAIQGSTNSDRLTVDEWNRIVARIGSSGPASSSVRPGQAATVPSVTGLSLAEAVLAVEAERLVPVVEYVWQGFEPDRVFEQSPPGGSRVQRGSVVAVRVDEGASNVSVAKYRGQLHSFDVKDSNLHHRFWDPKASAWSGGILAGPKAPANGFSKDPVTNTNVSVCLWGDQLQVFAGDAHCWFDGRRWFSERLK